MQKVQTKKSLKLNFIFNSILTASNFIFPLVTFPYISRILLPEGTGKVSFATSVIYYFNVFAQLGIPTYGIRACARVRDNRKMLTVTVREIMTINIFTTIISYMFFLTALYTVPQLAEEKGLMLIISLTMIFNTLGVEWLYKALEEYAYITIRSVLFKLIAVGAMFILVHNKNDYTLYGGISIFASSASNIFNFINMKKYVDKSRNRCRIQLRKHIKSIWVFFAMSVATTIYTHLDTVMLGFMKTDTDVGYYNAAVKIKTILISLVTSLGTVLLPRTSYYVEHGQQEAFENIIQKAFSFVVILSAAVSLYFILFAEQGIYFLSGTAFKGAILPMQIIMPTVFLVGMTNIMGIQMMIPLGLEKYVLYSEIVGAVVNVFVNIILIPQYASAGAAAGTVAAELAVFAVQFLVLKDTMKSVYKNICIIPIFLGLVLSGVLASTLKLLKLTPFFTLLGSGILFFGIYIVVLTKTKCKLVLEIQNELLNKIKRGFKGKA